MVAVVMSDMVISILFFSSILARSRIHVWCFIQSCCSRLRKVFVSILFFFQLINVKINGKETYLLKIPREVFIMYLLALTYSCQNLWKRCEQLERCESRTNKKLRTFQNFLYLSFKFSFSLSNNFKREKIRQYEVVSFSPTF